MPDTFRIYKKSGEKIAEGTSPLAITELSSGTVVNEGDYQATRVKGERESEKVNIAGFTVQEARGLNTAANDKPTENSTVPEIKEWLTKHNIDFSGKTLKADLLALIPND